MGTATRLTEQCFYAQGMFSTDVTYYNTRRRQEQLQVSHMCLKFVSLVGSRLQRILGEVAAVRLDSLGGPYSIDTRLRIEALRKITVYSSAGCERSCNDNHSL